MKRTYVLGMIVIAGAVAAAAANLGAQQPPAGGQGRQGGGGAAQELGKIEKVADNLYFIFGRGWKHWGVHRRRRVSSSSTPRIPTMARASSIR